ncbi:MAG: DNA topoisomerase IV [Spirochaeta sp. LUC14_002_19_P3]|nr:MAG: DNA topoisomerase IV [Spirochaeta sp. LUC14_002_19_P3]
MAQASQVYDESKIKTLSSLEHIRLRSGMYIGRLGDGSNSEDGIYILVKEVVDNAIDEYIMGFGKKVEIKHENGTISCRDYGRGIPHGKLVECVSVINTGAKYNDEVFQFSVGLNGVGTKAVNALSSYFLIRSYREGQYREAIFERGVLKKERKGSCTGHADGTYVEFIPDTQIFHEYGFVDEFISRRMWIYACLNRGLRIYYNGEKFESKKGLYDLLDNEVGETVLYPVIYHGSDKLEIAFTHTANYGETHFSFVNGQFTSDGGTHLSAFREGLLKGVNEFSKKNYSGTDVREGIAGAIAVKVQDPVFESQTKNKLGNTDIRSWIANEVKSAVVDYMHKNPETAKIIENKIITNEKLRKELSAVKKEAKAAANKISLNIPKLKDCKHHRGDAKGDMSTIFITEGVSATGSMVSCRDVYTQAIYSLRGKPWNSYGRGRTAIYKNEELFNLMMALGIENDVEELRYERIVIATDADTDGFHIRNLVLTFFLNYFEELVIGSHLFILETPLFRVRNKKETRYCYSERERDEAMKALKGHEVTRFKGLGEISPSEFGQFIGKDMRITPVGIESMKSVPELLAFYMGKNTPQRRDYIMENMI